jgi:cobalt-zinc-cadmium efflux system protein
VTAHGSNDSPAHRSEQRVLRIALWLNVALAASLFVAGVIADSSGLIANALDNTSDVAVYTISYYAVSRGTRWKTRAADLSGVMLIALSAGVLLDVARRFIFGAEPVGVVIVAMTLAAAIINIVCLRLLEGLRHQDVNLRAAWTFSINDLVSNLGVLVAGVLVAWLDQPWPDFVVGLAIAVVAAKGGLEILSDARQSART